MELFPIPTEELAAVQRALDLIEAAQHQLNAACCQLSRVHGFNTDWEQIRKHYDATKKQWHKVNAHREAIAALTPKETRP